MSEKKIKIGVIGLGYVGLPLAIEFGKYYETFGYDINKKRINELNKFKDSTNEVSRDSFLLSKNLRFTNELNPISDCSVYIITVPTPITKSKQPDLDPLISASNLVGKLLKSGDTVVYESTVYPGATEEICVPILASISGLKINKDFFVGYSPERINPGDHERRVTDIVKVTSGSNIKSAQFINDLYQSIIKAGTFMASSIKVAEAAKVIENTQRDLNISLINELSLIFNKLNIDTEDVLKAASTKWNFLQFKPGLVGGHCIGVDPYYLTYKAQLVGYHPEIILAGRRLNDQMAEITASRFVKALLEKSINVKTSSILILGLTFKENCPDLRNSKVFDLIDHLSQYGITIECYDPYVKKNIPTFSNFKLLKSLVTPKKYDGLIIAVAHKEFIELSSQNIKQFLNNPSVVFDMKYILDKAASDLRL